MWRLFVALSVADNLVMYGADVKDAYAHSPGPTRPTFMRLDDAFIDWYREQSQLKRER